MTALAERRKGWHLPGRAAVALASLAVAGFAVVAVIVLERRWREPGYAMPLAVLIVAGVCAVLAIAGSVLAVRRDPAVQPWLTLITTLLFLAAFITMFSIGAAVLLVAIASLVIRLRLRMRGAAGVLRFGVAPGLLVSLGVGSLALLVIQQPVVACMPSGVSNATPIWTWFASGASGSSAGGSGGQSSTSSQAITGSVSIGGTTYSYTCADGNLVEMTAH